MQRLARYLPFLQWLPHYGRPELRGDAVAGLTTAVMLIPQAMAYAMLAGLPPIIGLYASTVPLALYAFFGTSRELAVGPVAMVSLLVASGVGAVAEPGSASYVAHAIVLALMVGAIQLGMGLFRLGFLVNFLSHPVISGFTSAAALIIGFSQLKHLLGVDIARSHHVHDIVLQAIGKADAVHGATLAIGAASVALLVFLERWRPMFPRALAVVVLGTLAVWLLGLDATGVKHVGGVPAGLPRPTWPLSGLETSWTESLRALAPAAITISLVAFMESISVAKSFARKTRAEIDANQELVGLGLANLVGSLFGAYPVTGGFSRTAVNAQAGAKTGLASLVTAIIVALALVALTPLFFYLPKAVLAAIIMTAVFGLIDFAEIRHLYRVKRGDLALLALTFAATLGFGIEQGIMIGISASLLAFVFRTTRPHTAVLGRLPGTRAFRNVRNFEEAETFPGILMVRVDAQFYFGNVTFLKETLKRLEADVDAPLRAVIVDASSVNQLDSSADSALHEILDDYERRGIRLYFAYVKGPVRDVMHRSRLIERLGPESLHLEMHTALCAALGTDAPTSVATICNDESASREICDAGVVARVMLV